MKFKVRYVSEVVFIGTIEAETEKQARDMWDNGFTPYDEVEVDRLRDDLKEFKPA